MPYKRGLRLVFVSTRHDWAAQAAAIAGRLGEGRLEPRAADPADLASCLWADFILTLDEAARDALPLLPPRVQRRHLDLPGAGGASRRAERIASRVEGILGGLSMMARSDADGGPG